MIRGSADVNDAERFTEFLEERASKLRTVVRNNRLWKPEARKGFEEQFNSNLRCDGWCLHYFRPFAERVHDYEKVMTLKWTSEVHVDALPGTFRLGPRRQQSLVGNILATRSVKKPANTLTRRTRCTMDEEFKSMFLKLMESQQKLLTELALSRNAPTTTTEPGTSTTDARMEALANSMTEFHYDPDSNLTFENWYARHEDTLKCDAASLNDAARVRLLLRKLSDATHAEYMNHILPKQTRDFIFSETVNNLKKLFGAHASLFCKRYRCLTLSKRASDDFQTYAGQVNRCCEDFGVRQCSVDAFKCLIFVCGLHNKQDAEIRTSLLAKLEGNASMTLDNLTAECHRIINLRKDASIVEAPSDKSSVNSITRSRSDSTRHSSADQKSTAATRSRSPHNNARSSSSKNNNKPRTPCGSVVSCIMWSSASS